MSKPENGRPASNVFAHEAHLNGSSSLGANAVRPLKNQPDDFSFEVSLFSCLDNPKGRRETWSWAHACEQLTVCDIRPQKDGPLISSATYLPKLIHRAKENVVALSGLWVDCDESHTLAELRAIIKPLGVRAIIYSSHRHGTPDTKEHPNAHAPGERYRVFFPLEELLLIADYPDVWERLNLLFGGEIDAACKDAARAYFLPSHPTGEGFVTEVFEGRLLRLSDLPELPEEFHAPSYVPASGDGTGQGRPGDDFNARATNEDTAQILEAHGWRVWRSDASRWKAKRPGKNGPGISATIGHYGPGILHVFTSNAQPFEARRAYSPFGVLAQLDFGGDFKATARELAKRGFGESQKAKGALARGSDAKSDEPPEIAPVQSPEEIRAAFKSATSSAAPALALDELIVRFRKAMFVKDDGAIKIALAAFVANLCDGDPVWLMFVGGPSSGKTETVSPLAALPFARLVGTFTESALLSGTGKRDKAKDATGGLLREVGGFGVLLLKDFTSILSMHHDKRVSVLAALREIYDGVWVRDVGADGARKLEWRGKLGIIGCCTDAIESAHAVSGAMGERFMRYRLQHDTDDQKAMTRHALRRAGQDAKMRADLEQAVAGFFGALDIPTIPDPLTEEEEDRLIAVAMLTAKARSVVDRDPKSRDIELVHDAEIPTRLATMLRRVLHGLRIIGVCEPEAWAIIQKVALDSIPKLRAQIIGEVARELGTPTGAMLTAKAIEKALDSSAQATRRALEELRAHHVLTTEDTIIGGNKAAIWKLSELGAALWEEGFSAFPEKSQHTHTNGFSKAEPSVDLILKSTTTCKDDFPGKADFRAEPAREEVTL